MSDPVGPFWMFFLSPLLATATFAVLRGKHGQAVLKPAMILLVPAIPWFVFFTYSALNRWQEVGSPTNVGPVLGVASVCVFYGSPVLAAVVVLLAKGYRKWALLVGALNAVVGMATALLGTMMISGNWT